MHTMDEVTADAVKGEGRPWEGCPKAVLKPPTLSETSSAAERALARVRLAASRALASTSSPSLLPNSACVMLPKKPRSFCDTGKTTVMSSISEGDACLPCCLRRAAAWHER